MIEAFVEHSLVLKNAVGPRLLRAERLVCGWPELFGEALAEADLFLRDDGSLLIACARFEPSAHVHQLGARFAFWADRYDAAAVDFRSLDLRQRANFIANVEHCDHHLPGLAPQKLPWAFEQLLARAGIHRERDEDIRELPPLELRLGDNPACRWDAATKLLVVDGEKLPPVGDRISLHLTLPGFDQPVSVTSKVASARSKSFVLELIGAQPELMASLSALAVPRASPTGRERRTAPRHPLLAPVRLTYATAEALLKDYVTNLSVGGAFVATTRPAPLQSTVGLEISLPNGVVLQASGMVVSRQAAGMGIRFTLDPAAREELEQTVAALRVRAKPGRGPEIFQVNLANLEQLEAQLPTMMAGGLFVRTEREVALDAVVHVELQLPDKSVHLLRGTVVSTAPEGLGLELDPADLPALHSAISPDVPLDSGDRSWVSLVDLIEAPPPPPPDKPPPRLGNYELISLLGRGGMAEVYYAEAVAGPRAGSFVAIKRLTREMAEKPEAVELFVAEADILRLLDHPNIVRTYDIGVSNNQYYLVMEAIDGRDLDLIIKRCQQREIFLPIDFACYLLRCLLDALDYAHHAKSKTGAALNLVHCDVSPHNLFISRAGEIKLGDFGLAQVGTAGNGGKVRGKPLYLSPEAATGESSVQADLWAATVTFYELLTLQLPFKGNTISELFENIRKGRWVPVRKLRPEISVELEAALNKGFEKKAKHRYQSAAEFANALKGHFDENVGTPLAIAAVVRGLFD